jgi:hypothetical protein
MGPIVLLTGVLIVLYAVSALFAGGSVASASRGVTHSRRYALVTMIIGATVVAAGLIMILR